MQSNKPFVAGGNFARSRMSANSGQASTPKSEPNPVKGGQGLRDLTTAVVAEAYELEAQIESYLPSSVENVLVEMGLAGRPVLVTLLGVGAVVLLWKMSG